MNHRFPCSVVGKWAQAILGARSRNFPMGTKGHAWFSKGQRLYLSRVRKQTETECPQVWRREMNVHIGSTADVRGKGQKNYDRSSIINVKM